MENLKVLATVGERDITDRDIDLFVGNLDPQSAAQFRSEEGRKRLLSELINQELFYLDAVEKKLEEDEEFKAEISRVKRDILRQYAVSRIMKNIVIDEGEIVNYYSQNVERFKNPESIRASHILLDDESKANEIIGEINEGMSFEDAACKYSKCPSETNGGDLGFFTRGQMVQEFEDAAFSMKRDEIRGPVKTQFGYHIIKLVDKKQDDVKTLDEVRDQLRQYLLSKKQEEAYFSKVNELKGKYEIKMA